MNCPNCGAIVSIGDKHCPYCGRQNFVSVDDILNTPIQKGYIAIRENYECDSYRTADGTLHRAVSKPHRIITIVEG